MKRKIYAFLLSLTSVFVLSACLGGSGGEDVVVGIPDELTDEDIEIVMWHAYGQENQQVLDDAMEEFPHENITLRQVTKDNYDGLRSATMHAMVGGNTPDIVLGYPDHFVEYLTGDALLPLDEYIAHDDHGIDESDFVEAFMKENQQYQDGNQYSLPFSKSTEMIVYNKDKFEGNGYDLEENDYLYWSDLEDMTDMIGEGDNQCDKLYNHDSPDNMFIVSSKQFDAPYTNNDGEILVDNDTTMDMLNYFDGLMDDDILALPMEWEGESYGSEPFKQGQVCMSQGSTAGVRYNIPEDDEFQVGFLPSIQKEDGERAAIQQGPNVAVMSDNTDQERLAAWLIVKHLTNTENSTQLSLSTGYMPVRTSSFESQEFQDVIQLADTDDPSSLTPEERDAYPTAQALKVARDQTDIYSYEPAFTGIASSSAARTEAGTAIENIYGGTSPEDALQIMLDELRQ